MPPRIFRLNKFFINHHQISQLGTAAFQYYSNSKEYLVRMEVDSKTIHKASSSTRKMSVESRACKYMTLQCFVAEI